MRGQGQGCALLRSAQGRHRAATRKETGRRGPGLGSTCDSTSAQGTAGLHGGPGRADGREEVAVEGPARMLPREHRNQDKRGPRETQAVSGTSAHAQAGGAQPEAGSYTRGTFRWTAPSAPHLVPPRRGTFRWARGSLPRRPLNWGRRRRKRVVWVKALEPVWPF